MVLIGDYIAIGLVAILCLFYFETAYFPTRASKYFAVCLPLTAITAILDVTAVYMLKASSIPVQLNVAVNTLFFIFNLLTTTMIAMVLFSKILEHVHDSHCLKQAQIMMSIIFGLYLVIVVVNIWTGILFFFGKNGEYVRGPFNAIGYALTVVQMILVSVCYVKNRRYASREISRALVHMMPIALLCIVLQLLLPNVLLNSLIMSLVEMVLFLNFQNSRSGVHRLTNLNDRHKFLKYIENIIAHQKSYRAFVIKIKNFDAINQKYGRKAGDEILYLFAFSLEKVIKRSNAFHLDNVKFALLINEENCKDIDCLKALTDFLENGINYGNERVLLDYSLLENVIDKDSDSSVIYEEIEYAASITENSSLRYLRYTPEIRNDMLRQRYLIKRLSTVDSEHGYEVWFQPVKCVNSGRFCSLESLIRLRESDGSFISPGEFIPVAENADMIAPITKFVLEESCRIISSHPELEGLSFSINIPMAQLSDLSFVDYLNSVTEKYSIEHSRVCLEFTERVMTGELENVSKCMTKICSEGYRFFLDDFGEGFSNFSCILSLPFSSVKLDRSITVTAGDHTSRHAIVNMLTELFHNMSLEVIAEGVETENQVEILSRLGIDKLQGYYFARPMPESALIEFFKN